MNQKKEILKALDPVLASFVAEHTSLGDSLFSPAFIEKVKAIFQGNDGKDGKDGYSPIKGKDYFTDEEIIDLVTYTIGKSTPVKGKDYFTPEEIADSITDVKKYILSYVRSLGLRPGKDGKDGQDGSPDTPEEVVQKVNKSKTKIKSDQVEGFTKTEDIIKELKKNKSLEAKDIKGLNMNDQRWHGGGLSQVYHDNTLTGTGTASSPLSVVGGGSGIDLEVNGTPNVDQTLLNLVQGTNMTITDNGDGSVTFDATGSGAVDSVNGQTGVVVLDTGDIAEVTDKNYVTDADITNLGNLSGTNTGDVTLAGEDFLSITNQVITANPIDLDNLSATGTPSATTFLRGDNTWATPAGGFADFDVGGDSGVDVTVDSGDLLDIVGGTGIDTTVSKASTTVTQSIALDSATQASLALADTSVQSISIASSNGFAGSSSGGTTPALTISTSITGILKGNGTAISAGTAGDVDSILPTQTGNSGKFLTTDGSNSSWGTPSGSGDVVGPASATDNALARFDSTTGKLIQNSVATLSDTGDLTIYDATNDGNPFVNIGSSATNRFLTTVNYAGGTQDLFYVKFQTDSSSAQTDYGYYRFNVDGVDIMDIADVGIKMQQSKSFYIGNDAILADSAGTLTLSKVDALDSTTETTIENAIDTLANLTSIQGKTVTLGGNFITSGASSLTLTTTGATNVTLPTTGTLATLAGTESLTNKKLGSLTSNGLVTTSGSDGTLSVTVPGTGVLTALAVNVGSAGAFITFNGDAGTPSAIALTNATGLPLTTGVTGILPLANGGTGSNLSDPGADRIGFWDDSAGTFTWLTVGSGLSITDTTISASGGGVTFVDNEVADGSGTSFTIANTPTAGSVHVYARGQRLKLTDQYTISGTTITTALSWSAGDIVVDYRM